MVAVVSKVDRQGKRAEEMVQVGTHRVLSHLSYVLSSGDRPHASHLIHELLRYLFIDIVYDHCIVWLDFRPQVLGHWIACVSWCEQVAGQRSWACVRARIHTHSSQANEAIAGM